MKLKRWQNRGSAQPDQTGSFDRNLNPLNIAVDEEDFFFLFFILFFCFHLTRYISCLASHIRCYLSMDICLGATRQVREDFCSI